MKQLYLKTLFISLSLLLTNISTADSFLTTTPFSKAYQDKRIVRKAAKADLLTKKLIKYILKKNKPLDIKLAVINQLGWNVDGQSNLQLLVDYVVFKNMFASYKDLIDNADADLLTCIAYIKALDDYGNIREVKSIAYKATRMGTKDSMSAHLVYTLISAQESQIKDRWCKAFTICENFKNDTSLKRDIRVNALQVVFDYAKPYGKYCE